MQQEKAAHCGTRAADALFSFHRVICFFLSEGSGGRGGSEPSDHEHYNSRCIALIKFNYRNEATRILSPVGRGAGRHSGPPKGMVQGKVQAEGSGWSS